MHYEDVTIKHGDTVSKLINDYGHSPANWLTVWDDAKNASLKANRSTPDKIKPGDIINIPTPWRMVTKSLTMNPTNTRVIFQVTRSGLKGKYLRWVQTVNQSNQPIGATPKFCVDACPPDDSDPFYFTSAELTSNPGFRKNFSDIPSRMPPATTAGATKWRAIVSVAVVTGKRVTLIDSQVWGFDLTPAGNLSKVGPRAATIHEINGHLNLLRHGTGSGGPFNSAGWTFRKP
jgi:hypothetical protein